MTGASLPLADGQAPGHMWPPGFTLSRRAARATASQESSKIILLLSQVHHAGGSWHSASAAETQEEKILAPEAGQTEARAGEEKVPAGPAQVTESVKEKKSESKLTSHSGGGLRGVRAVLVVLSVLNVHRTPRCFLSV